MELQTFIMFVLLPWYLAVTAQVRIILTSLLLWSTLQTTRIICLAASQNSLIGCPSNQNDQLWLHPAFSHFFTPLNFRGIAKNLNTEARRTQRG